jgi:hypothetical protein
LHQLAACGFEIGKGLGQNTPPVLSIHIHSEYWRFPPILKNSHFYVAHPVFSDV